MIAFVKTDSLESPAVLHDLEVYLQSQDIKVHYTERHWKDIHFDGPFVYLRNPYVRVNRLGEIAKFHKSTPDFSYIRCHDGEVISVNNSSKNGCSFNLNVFSSYKEPDIEPLPILIGLYKRPIYAQLTLNSLLHSLHSPRQRLFIVASQPSKEMEDIVTKILDTSPIKVEAVKCDVNLAYSFANFGSKYFGLKRFIHFEEDGVLPENVSYHMPYWTNQFNYRSTTCDFLSLKVSKQNYTAEFYKSEMYHKGKIVDIPDKDLWHYTRPPRPDEIIPIGGVGCVIDSEKMYKNFNPPEFCTTDQRIIMASKRICIANVPVYHIGANQEMDYPEYFASKRVHKPFNLAQLQAGTDMRSGSKKIVDLGLDWCESVH